MSSTAFILMAFINLWAAYDMYRIDNYGLTVVFVCYGVACVAYIWGAR